MARDAQTLGDSEATYELTLKGAGVEVHRTVTQSVAVRIVALVMGGGGPPAASSGAAATPLGAATSLGEFFHQIGAKRNPDKILGIATYLTRYLGRPTFTKDELKSQFQAASEPVPGNFPRDLAWTLSNRWLAPSHDNPTEFFVTATGLRAIDEGLDGEVKRATRLKPVRSKRLKRSTK